MTVNGTVVRELGTKADLDSDHIKVNGKLLRPEPHAYYIVNKPAGVLCAAADASDRRLVVDLVHSPFRLYPAGRLDFDSEGLVLLTNDGDLTKAVTEAGKVAKVYRVKVHGTPTRENLDRLIKGVRLKDGTQLAPCRLRFLKVDKNSWIELILRQGKNRQIRRMFEEIGHGVMRLKRIAIGPLTTVGLRTGESRKLKPEEVDRLWASVLGKKKPVKR